MYYNDNNGYPANLDFSGTGSITTGTRVYMTIAPSNPIPRSSGSCTDNNYIYTRDGAHSYHIEYCLGEATGGIMAGIGFATPSGIRNN